LEEGGKEKKTQDIKIGKVVERDTVSQEIKGLWKEKKEKKGS